MDNTSIILILKRRKSTLREIKGSAQGHKWMESGFDPWYPDLKVLILNHHVHVLYWPQEASMNIPVSHQRTLKYKQITTLTLQVAEILGPRCFSLLIWYFFYHNSFCHYLKTSRAMCGSYKCCYLQITRVKQCLEHKCLYRERSKNYNINSFIHILKLKKMC